MGRYLRFGSPATLNFDYATRADVSWKKEYFKDFVFGGERDQRVYGFVKLTPEMDVEYDLNGLMFLAYVMGSFNTGTITVTDINECGTVYAGIDGKGAGVINAKVNTWEMNVEEGNPIRANFNVIGKNTTTLAPAAYTTDFCSDALLPSDVSVTIETSSISFSKLSLKIDNGLEAIFKTSTLPVTIRPTGLEITGNLSVPEYLDANVQDGAMTITIANYGVISLPTVKFMEIPPKAKGYDIPETNYSFEAFPGCSLSAISAVLSNTIKW